MTEPDHSVLIAVIGGLVTVAVAVLSALTAYLASKRERRRVLYSEAVRAATAWEELLYRVRRRKAGDEHALVERFHDAQDSLSYQRAWIASESKYMARSYDKLVAEVKDATQDLIRQAWKAPERPVPGDALPEDDHPRLKPKTDRFMKDVRSHLSPLLWRRIAVVWRNREK